MTIEVWATFVISAFIILMIPGPTIMFVVTQTLAHGRKATIPLVAGVVAGDFLCITLSLLGLSALLAASSFLFALLKYAGAAYLIWLGIDMLRKGVKEASLSVAKQVVSQNRLFTHVMAVSALNPKGVMFYSAFMPQFVNPSAHVTTQLIILAFTFLGMAVVNALFYSVLANRASKYFSAPSKKRWFNFTGGVTLIGAGALTASVRNA